MAFDPDHGIVININPQLALKQILVFPSSCHLHDETVVGSHLLFARQTAMKRSLILIIGVAIFSSLALDFFASILKTSHATPKSVLYDV